MPVEEGRAGELAHPIGPIGVGSETAEGLNQAIHIPELNGQTTASLRIVSADSLCSGPTKIAGRPEAMAP